MKINNTIVAAAIGILAGTTLASASTDDEAAYRILAYNDCKEVATVAMTHEQVLTYQDLKAAGDQMAQLEVPIESIQAEVERFSADIEALSERAVVEEGDVVTINKALLRDQERLAGEIQKLVAAHQTDFDALEKQGTEISNIATRFEQSVEDSLRDVNYDQIRIATPDKQVDFQCHNDISFM